MNKTQLKQIIKEEMRKYLNETQVEEGFMSKAKGMIGIENKALNAAIDTADDAIDALTGDGKRHEWTGDTQELDNLVMTARGKKKKVVHAMTKEGGTKAQRHEAKQLTLRFKDALRKAKEWAAEMYRQAPATRKPSFEFWRPEE